MSPGSPLCVCILFPPLVPDDDDDDDADGAALGLGLASLRGSQHPTRPGRRTKKRMPRSAPRVGPCLDGRGIGELPSTTTKAMAIPTTPPSPPLSPLPPLLPAGGTTANQTGEDVLPPGFFDDEEDDRLCRRQLTSWSISSVVTPVLGGVAEVARGSPPSPVLVPPPKNRQHGKGQVPAHLGSMDASTEGPGPVRASPASAQLSLSAQL
ncbi:hypothetical protein XA68_11739 [Ophiocordyceps unilateralis]|uniref:Uncharacterized protein n=1 Tax=Ophiocordyceps unilateralis TaxID=268505 RepID=A0A2A9PFU2_OPHUN|nr:hypothetical protein XA68_11739 [Ophiocordyceps unilateralis]